LKSIRRKLIDIEHRVKIISNDQKPVMSQERQLKKKLMRDYGIRTGKQLRKFLKEERAIRR